MSEKLFLIEENPEGGYTARAVDVGFSIFTEGESVEELKRNIVDALQCHFDEEHDIPKVIQLHFGKDEVMHNAPAS